MTIAALLAISTSDLQCYFERRFRSKLLAATLSSLLLATLFFGPFIYILTTMTMMLKGVDMGSFVDFERYIKQSISELLAHFEFLQPYFMQFVDEIDIKSLLAKLAALTGKVGAFSAGFIKNAFLVVIFYFFAQYHSSLIVRFLKRVVQMDEKDTRILSRELSSVMSVVFYSILVTAAFEGLLFGLAVSYLGYNGLFYGILFGFTSLVPVVGAALMWVPFMSYELYLGNTLGAIFIALYTVIVISVIADTFIKPIIIKAINKKLLSDNDAKLDSLVIFFAMLAGLATFGFWGMILGPAITAFFLAILKVFEIRTKACRIQEQKESQEE